MSSSPTYLRFLDLRRYVDWCDDDAQRLRVLGDALAPSLPALIDDFYAEIQRHEGTLRVITGGAAQIERLKASLRVWIQELFHGPHDEAYVQRRWRVGQRHVEIGLEQVFTSMALARMRANINQAITGLDCPINERIAMMTSLNKALDLDLALIEDAYQAAYHERQQRIERLATMGHIAGGIAHELRNPLNVVRTSSYYLLNARNATPEKTREHLQRIDQQVGIADSVITALSSFARLPLPEMKPFDVAECVRETLENAALPPTVTVDVSLPADLPLAHGDRHQLTIVFANLIRNAVEAMPNGGLLRVVAQSSGQQHIEVGVEDCGVGIAADQLQRILEPFFSTKPRGLGLGLSLVKAILDRQQGLLHVTSTPGQGSKFCIRLLAATERGKAT